jgi:hypothetical protein
MSALGAALRRKFPSPQAAVAKLFNVSMDEATQLVRENENEQRQSSSDARARRVARARDALTKMSRDSKGRRAADQLDDDALLELIDKLGINPEGTDQIDPENPGVGQRPIDDAFARATRPARPARDQPPPFSGRPTTGIENGSLRPSLDPVNAAADSASFFRLFPNASRNPGDLMGVQPGPAPRDRSRAAMDARAARIGNVESFNARFPSAAAADAANRRVGLG